MASNSFGQIFRITTFGESHGPGVGVIIDGCPAGIVITLEEIDAELMLRRPGHHPNTSPRKEPDKVEIISGIFEGQTTGAPISLFIRNKDADSNQYDVIKNLYRPGHANFTYLEKYGIYDYRGGGRASARETAARVAAGAVAKKFIAIHDCSCKATLEKIENLQAIKDEGDSVGGIVTCTAKVPPGLGDPIYNKLEATLAYAMLSIPASKGFEIGAGFAAAKMRGSEHNDVFDLDEEGKVVTQTNHAGGVLGGITTGAPLLFRVAFKPTSSIKKPQETVSLGKEKITFQLPQSARHDPCVAIRAVPIVEAMTALVIADALLMQRCTPARLSASHNVKVGG